ncbi:MAG: ketopantoate reductase family protein [Microbacteriaceae bacterium]
MRIAVLGAGAVGGTLAALLARAGHQVEVTARGENLDAIREHGLRLTGGYGEYTAHVATGISSPELAILATKAQDAAGALRDAATALQGVPLVVVQNGLGGLRVAHEQLPGSPLIGGLALMAASYVSPGVVTVTGGNPLILGAGPGCTPETLTAVAQVLGGAIEVEVTPDIVGAQWTKLLINHVNALPAITGLSVQEVVADRRLLRVMTASMRETVRIARAIGVHFGAVQGVSGGILNLIGIAPLWLGAAFPKLLRRRMGDVPNPGSTLQSVRRGRLTEIDFLNGAVVAAAAEHGRDAPVNTAIVEMVHEVERTGAFLTPGQVVARASV